MACADGLSRPPSSCAGASLAAVSCLSAVVSLPSPPPLFFSFLLSPAWFSEWYHLHPVVLGFSFFHFWGLNPGPHTGWACALPLSCPSSIQLLNMNVLLCSHPPTSSRGYFLSTCLLCSQPGVLIFLEHSSIDLASLLVSQAAFRCSLKKKYTTVSLSCLRALGDFPSG